MTGDPREVMVQAGEGAGRTLVRIVSGGQTGVDRAALDVALELGIRAGGWVPAGRGAEDGPIPARYPGLRETESADAAERTRLNVRDSDGTLILSRSPLSGGSLLTLETALALGRPVLRLDLAAVPDREAVRRARAWLEEHGIAVLNVAGPRASSDPGIHDVATRLLRRILGAPEPFPPDAPAGAAPRDGREAP